MQAALEMSKILRHSPAHIFSNIAQRNGAGLGVFTAQEKLVVFPEYYRLKDTPDCHGQCLLEFPPTTVSLSSALCTFDLSPLSD